VVNLGEPADLLHVYGRRCVARWRWAGEHQAAEQWAAYGWLPDGRWWADTSVVLRGGRLFPVGDDASARAYCAAMMARHAPPDQWAEAWPEHVPGAVPGQRQDPPPYPPGDPRSAAGDPPA